MAISLTEPAAERVRSYLDARGNGIGLRVGVKKTGCNGFAYVINYADAIEDGDVVFEGRGVKVVVDRIKPRTYRRYGSGFRERGPQRGISLP